MLVVNIRHWLDDRGELPLSPAPLRKNALRVARLIEYGGPLRVGEARETLVECTKRVDRKPCPGLMWVLKPEKATILAECVHCGRDQVHITGWEFTIWADGVMDPVPIDGDQGSAPPAPDEDVYN
jgi:hypothetical protein